MKVFVVGAGVMASGIVQVFATAGYKVTFTDISEVSIEKAHKRFEKNLSRMVEKEKITADKKAEILSNISSTSDIKDAKDADLVVESIVEIMDIKKQVLQQLDEICDKKTILATNTSSLSITELAVATKRPHKVIGMHFFNPAPVMKLIEIIKGYATDEKVYKTIYETTEKLGKIPVTVEEAPGFVVNRILIPMINEAAGIYAEGVATVEDVDNAMKYGANHPIGPLALGDLVGLDVCMKIMDILYNEFNDPKYRCHPLINKMVRAGKLGRKSGEGFYNYN